MKITPNLVGSRLSGNPSKKRALFDKILVIDERGRSVAAVLRKDGPGRWVWASHNGTYGGIYDNKPDARADILEYGYSPIFERDENPVRPLRKPPAGPSPGETAAARFRRFTGSAPSRADKITLARAPAAAMLIGSLDGVLYTTVRDGKIERYKHEFHANDKPALISSDDGKQLFIHGGRYKFTERGIVDATRPEKRKP